MAAPLVKTKTPGIYKRGSRYVFSYRVNGRQRWESCRTLDEARRAKAARQTDIGRGEFEERSRLTLHDYAADVGRYQGRGRRGFREDTRADYQRQLEQYVFEFFPQRTRLTDVTPSAVADFVGWLCDGRKQVKLHHRLKVQRARAAGNREPKPLGPDAKRELSDSTVRNIMAPLRACLATAVREGLIRHNPARDIDLPHRPTVGNDEADTQVLTKEQLDAFLRIVHPRYRLFFRFLASTGVRVSEAIGLQWRHVQLDGSTPHIRVRQRIVRGRVGLPKSKYGRRDIPIDHGLVRALRRYRMASRWSGDTDPVFPSTTGTPLRPNNVFNRVLRPAAEEAGAPWAGFHTFRHTCASLLFDSGRNAVQVQRWLGHHSPAFTLATYVHLLDGDIGGPLALGDFLGANEVRTDATPLHATPERFEDADPLARRASMVPTTPLGTAGHDYDSAALTD
jgi:integrase